jgi:hypothetical protein
MAVQKALLVNNLYDPYHAVLAMEAPRIEEQFKALPKDTRGGKHFFAGSANSLVNMYASHSPNDHREENAISPYIQCEVVDRSPWNLLEKDEQIQELMTVNIYDLYFNKQPKETINSDEFIRFIETENNGKELGNYLNTFENRFVLISSDQELEVLLPKEELNITKLSELKTSLTQLMKPVQHIGHLFGRSRSHCPKNIK